MFCEIRRIVAHKTRKLFLLTNRKQTAQGLCFTNERQPNSPHGETIRRERCSGRAFSRCFRKHWKKN